jgi:dTDP-4-amino-4,6-dideoxygalactose transaminase
MEGPVPFSDVRRHHAAIAPALEHSLSAFLTGAPGSDAELGRFEDEFADLCGTEDCVGVASGTAALRLALTATGIGPGDEVIVPALAGSGPALAVIHSGATPVLCDVRAETALIDARSAAEVVGPRSAAVIAIHLYGQPCDMHELAAFAQRNQLLLIEQTSQATGGKFAGRPLGSWGDVSAFGFDPEANLASLGNGGAVCTDDASVAERVRRLRNLGRTHTGEQVEIGSEDALHELHAGFLRVKLGSLAQRNRARGGWADVYDARLPATAISPWRDPRGESTFGVYPIRVPRRAWVRNELRQRGIQTRVYNSPALHAQPALAGRCLSRTKLVDADEWSQEELCLPAFPELTNDEVTRVVEALEEVLAEETRQPAERPSMPPGPSA